MSLSFEELFEELMAYYYDDKFDRDESDLLDELVEQAMLEDAHLNPLEY